MYLLRRILFLSAALAFSACSAAGGGNATPAGISAQSAAPDLTSHFVFHPLAIHPNAGTPAVLMNFVADGPNQGGVPCINCVNGASTGDNVGMTGPSSYVPTNFVWQYAISFTDISYKGKCKVTWTIAAGKKTIDTFGATLTLQSAGGFVLYAVARNRPKYSGPAVLTGKYVCGKNSGSAQAPLQFE